MKKVPSGIFAHGNTPEKEFSLKRSSNWTSSERNWNDYSFNIFGKLQKILKDESGQASGTFLEKIIEQENFPEYDSGN